MNRALLTWAVLLFACPLLRADDSETEVRPVEVVALDRQDSVDYQTEIRPIFVKRCLVCHSGGVTEGKLDLSSIKSLLRGGEHGPAAQPGKPAESLLVKLVGRTAKPYMPPPDADNSEEEETEPLSPKELALIKLWISQGAKPSEATTTRVPLVRLSPSTHVVRALAIAPDKSLLAAGRANQIHLYDAASGEFVRTLGASPEAAGDDQRANAAHQAIVESLAFSPDGQLLASGAFQEAALWNAKTGALQHRLSGFAHRVTAVAFSPDGRHLAAAGGAPTVSGEIKVFEAAGGKQVLAIEDGHSDTVFDLQFSPDGRMLATASADQTIKIFAFPDGKLIKKLEGHTHHVLGVAWQADGRLIASAGADKKVRLWDVEKGEQHTKIQRGGGQISTIFLDHKSQVNRLTFIGDTRQILTVSGHQPLQLWRLSKEMRPGNYAKPYLRGGVDRSFGDGSDYLYTLSASPDGTLVAAGGRAGTVWLYNATDDKLIKALVPPDADPPALNAAAASE